MSITLATQKKEQLKKEIKAIESIKGKTATSKTHITPAIQQYREQKRLEQLPFNISGDINIQQYYQNPNYIKEFYPNGKLKRLYRKPDTYTAYHQKGKSEDNRLGS